MTPGLQPDLIVETSITHGGSPIFSASMQELIAVCGGLLDAETPRRRARARHPRPQPRGGQGAPCSST